MYVSWFWLTYLEGVGGKGAEDLWRDVQTWRAGQREIAVQILAAHRLLHQPVNQSTASQQNILLAFTLQASASIKYTYIIQRYTDVS